MAKSVRRVFDPQKNYKWEPTDEFVITGEQFMTLFHSLKYIAYGTELSPIAKVEAYQIVQKIFEEGIANGVIVEIEDIPNHPPPLNNLVQTND